MSKNIFKIALIDFRTDVQKWQLHNEGGGREMKPLWQPRDSGHLWHYLSHPPPLPPALLINQISPPPRILHAKLKYVKKKNGNKHPNITVHFVQPEGE